MTSIERFDISLERMTFQARRAGPADGRPVILLHGVPQTSACWTAQLEALADAGYHAVAYTQRGCSPGARIDDINEFTLDKLAGDVLGVADALGFAQFDLVGHDMGAGVAWRLAASHPTRLRTLTALSVPHPNAYQDAYRRWIPEPGPGDDQFVRSGHVREFRRAPQGEMERAFVADDCRRLRAAYDGLPADHVAEYLELLGTVEAMRGVLAPYRTFTDSPGADTGAARLPPITLPTLFVWSDGDPAIAAAGAYATGDHVTGPYRFVELEGFDHWIPERAPERLNKELLAHLAQYPA
jgi:pimeloyl-ACP methyl ester carboxylesterase